jgi:hypothetical protein
MGRIAPWPLDPCVIAYAGSLAADPSSGTGRDRPDGMTDHG